MLNCWQTQGSSGGIFRNHIGDAPTSEASSEYYTDEPNHDNGSADNGATQNVRFVVSDLSQGSAGSSGRLLSAISPGAVKSPSPSDYFAAEEGNAGGFDFRRENGASSGTSPLRNVVAGENYNRTEDVTPQSRLNVTGGAKKLAWSDES